MQNNNKDDFGIVPVIFWGIIIFLLIVAFFPNVLTSCSNPRNDVKFVEGDPDAARSDAQSDYDHYIDKWYERQQMEGMDFGDYYDD